MGKGEVMADKERSRQAYQKDIKRRRLDDQADDRNHTIYDDRGPGKKTKRRRGCCLGCLGMLLFLLVALALAGFFVFRDVRNSAQQTYEEIGEEQVVHPTRENGPVDTDSAQPFSVLLMGIDTGDIGRTEQGRSDTMMVLTVDPVEDEMTLVSIPRDTYTEIIGTGNMDKINHSYAIGGTSMTVNTVQNLLDIPIDYYVSVNMQGLQQIVNAVGGITVVPPLSFSQSGYQFVEGQPTHMDGQQTLAYARMRYEDPQGDYGRQARQRQVVQAILSEIASIESITNYRGILETISTNMKTNLSFGDMVNLFNEYQDVETDVDQIQLRGEGTHINGVYYDIIPQDHLAEVSAYLQDELEL